MQRCVQRCMDHKTFLTDRRNSQETNAKLVSAKKKKIRQANCLERNIRIIFEMLQIRFEVASFFL